jgi:kynureninase
VPEHSPWLEALAALGSGPLTEAGLVRHVHPLFAKTLGHNRGRIYLANHSLGRPLDQTEHDVQEALQPWYQDIRGAWGAWLAERERFREGVADLIHAPGADSIVPKASAGQGLRAVLNAYPQPIVVLSSRDEFDSVDFILKVYAARGRIELRFVGPDETGRYHIDALCRHLTPDVDLVVISLVLFTTGQIIGPLDELTRAAHARGARVLVDLYHATGALPVDIQALDADFAIGGCYKYLRGGPGAGWLYVHPRHLQAPLRTLDTGWFAQAQPFDFKRPEQPRLAPGGNTWLEATPAVLPFFQARAGLAFTATMDVQRLRDYSIRQQMLLQKELASRGVSVTGDAVERGAFLTIRVPDAERIAHRLEQEGIVTDARGERLRLCPDILNTDQELRTAARRIAQLVA